MQHILMNTFPVLLRHIRFFFMFQVLQDLLAQSVYQQEDIYNDALSWLQIGRGMWGVTKAVHMQQPRIMITTKLLKHVVGTGANLAKLAPARLAVGGAVAAFGLLAVQRTLASELVHLKAIPVILDLMDVEVRCITCIIWHNECAYFIQSIWTQPILDRICKHCNHSMVSNSLDVYFSHEKQLNLVNCNIFWKLIRRDIDPPATTSTRASSVSSTQRGGRVRA